jgi:hypothetical protein
MTGSASAGAAAFRFDAGHRVADGIFHDGRTLIDIKIEACAVEGDNSQFGHGKFR